MNRSLLTLMVVPLVVLCTACFGGSTPATHVTSTSATLNAMGATDEMGAETFFEYRVVAGATQVTPTVTIDGAAEGPFRMKVKNLTPSTNYEYRICGRDIGSIPFNCEGSWTAFSTPA